MKINPPNQVNFTFGKDKEELYNQAEFLVTYYVARLKLLKSENLYITAEQAAEETFYKDVISACMLFLQDKENIKTNNENERTIGKSKTVSRDISPGELTETNTHRREHLSFAPSLDGRGE